jgi:uncharacterized membrane protein YgcG
MGVRRWLALLIGAVAALVVLVPTSTHASADKSFSLPSLDTTAVVSPDGSMQVTEVVTYDFSGGPFNFGIRSFTRNDDRGRIVDFTAADDLGPLTVIPPNDSVSGEWEWQLRAPTSDRRVTYTLSYRVPNAVTVHADVADLYWQFIGDDHPGVGQMHVSVRFPAGIPAAQPGVADDDASVIRAFAHGPSNGTISVSESVADAVVSDVPAGDFVELRVITPASAYTITGPSQALPRILADERSYLAEVKDTAEKRRLGWILTPVLGGLGLLGTVAVWLTGGREKKSTEVLGDYWREPLDEPPAVALANLNRGNIEPNATIAGTIVDLAQRGYLRIVGTREERFGPDKTVHEYHWLGKPTNDLLGYENDVLQMVFRGQAVSTSDEMTAWAKQHQSEARSLLAKVKGGVTRSYTARRYEEKGNARMKGALFAVCAAVALGSVGLKFYTGNGVAWVGVGAAVALFAVGSQVLRNRTQAGAEAAAKAAGLKRFLKDFSQLEDAPIGHLILWERYLVFAVTLGVSHELIQGLAARIPALMNDPGFAVWYVGPHGRFDGFDQIRTTTAASYVSASTPNSSGSGGGFSGGGGGGGGGGGFGAR